MAYNNFGAYDGTVDLVTDQAETFGIAIVCPDVAYDEQWMRDFTDWLQGHMPSGVIWTGNVTDVTIGVYKSSIVTPNP